jgi:uncharacterized repeat protein (TIGR02543 family)
MEKRFNRSDFAGILLAALVLSVVLSLVAVPTAAKAIFTITIDTVNGYSLPPPTLTNPIHLAGSASVTNNFPGQLSSYQVQVDWGDGTIDPDSTVNFVQSGDDFSGTWSSSPDHSYTVAGLHTITVKLYHARPPGGEAGDDSFNVSVAIIWSVTFYTNPTNGNITAGGVTKNNGDTGAYDNGAVVSIVPNAPANYHFTGWATTGGVSVNIAPEPDNMTVTGDGNLTAIFAVNQISITVTSSPAGVGFVRVDSNPITTPQTFMWDEDSTHNLEALSPVSGGAGVQHIFTDWSDGGFGAHTYTVPSSPATVTANYKTQYNVSFSQSGSGATVTVGFSLSNGTSGSEDAPFWFWVDKNLQITYTYPAIVAGGAGVQYVLTGVAPSSPQTVTSSLAIVGSYKTQFYITVTSAHDTPTVSAWVDKGNNFPTSVTSPTEIVAGDHQFVCTGYKLDGGSLTPGASYTFVNVQAPHTIEYDWKEQFWIQVNSAHDTPTASAWVDQGANYGTSVTSPTEIVAGDHQWLCTGYKIDGGSLTPGMSYTFTNVQAAHTIEFDWKEQFYLTVTSAHDSPTGEGWYDDGATASSSVTSPVAGGSDVQYVTTGYTGTGSAPSGSGTSVSFTITQASIITWNWKTQFYITVTSAHDTPTASAWVDQGDDFPTSVTSPDVVSSVDQWVCTGYKLDGGALTPGTSYTFTNVQEPHTVEYDWKEQFWLAVTSAYDTAGGQGWYDSGDTAYATLVTGVVPDGLGVQHVFTGWSGDASGSGLTSDPITMDEPRSATADWKTQYEVAFSVYPVGAGSTSPSGTLWLDEGSNGISASANLGYQFFEWTATGSISFADDSLASTTATVNGPGTITANFKVRITITSSPAGSGFVKVDGNPIVTPATFYWEVGEEHTLEALSPVPNGPVEQYVWLTWSDAGSQVHSYAVPSSPATVTANYKTQFYVTFSQSGIGGDSGTNTVVTIGGSDKNAGDLPLSGWYDSGTTYSFAATVATSVTGKRYANTGVTGPASPIVAAGTVTGNYVTQFYLTMTTNYGSVLPGSGWRDSGSVVAISAAAPITVAGERYFWLGWTGTGTISYTGALNPSSITMNGPITEAAAWRREFSLTVVSLYDAPDPTVGVHWYAPGTTIDANVTSPATGPGGEREVCTGWTGSGSVPAHGNTTAVTFVIAAPSSITWNWMIQFYLNVSSAHGTVGGEGWYDPGATAYALVTPLTVEDVGGIRYTFINWTVDATGSTSPSDPIIMDRDKTAVANWEVELRLDVVSAYDSPFGAGWYEPNATANFGVTTPVNLGNNTLLVFVGWSGDVIQTAPTGSIVMTKPSTVVATWIIQYLVTFNTTLPNGNRLTIPGVPQALPPGLDIFGAFYQAGSTAAGGPAPLITPGPDNTRYVFKGWYLDGVLLTPGADFSFLVNAPHNASMVFDTEFLLVVNATGVTAPFNATLTITASPPMPRQLSPISALEEWFGKNAGLTLLISTPNKIGHGEWAVFNAWSGNAQGTTKSISLVMTGPKMVNAIFFKTNPVAESIPYSLAVGLICFGLAYYMTRNKKGEEKSEEKSEHKGYSRLTFGIAVSAVAILVAAVVSAMIATGYSINVGELPDLTNWAVLFLGVEALVLFYATYRFTKGGQPKQAQAAPEITKVPANPYGV